MAIDGFPAWARLGEWKELVQELETGQYYPFPVRFVGFDTADSGKRQ
ncbi:MAG: RNA-directed DNA polymerase [Oleiphilaceae bacterium]|jgi:RNA-directed DNA polymerase